MLDTIPELALLAATIGSGYLLLWRSRLRDSLPPPPGPPSYPIIGQLLSVPQTSEAQAFADIGAKVNSDVVSLSFLGVTIVSLNSAEAASDLFEKRPNIYSGRFSPPMISSPRLLGLQDFVAFMNSTEFWRKQRRAMNASLNKKSVLGFRAAQELEARKLLQRLLSCSVELESSDELNLELHRVVGSILLDSVYGYELKSADDQFLTENMELNHNLAQAILPSQFLVNVVPWLAYVPEWFPGAHWKKVAREWRDQKDRAMSGPYDWAKQRIDRGADDYSAVASALKDAQESGLGKSEADRFAKYVGTAIFAGAMETSTSAMLSFTLAMVLHPEAQAKAQREIDTVVGLERLPTAEDRKNLPYTERLVNEVLRWQPSLPIGVPHICMEDDEYRGYKIPKGAITIGNIWAITRDERIYKDPESFNPDRFLDPAVPVPPIFGWGIRICPGQHFLREMFFIEVVSMLAVFNISKFKDNNGQVVEPSTTAAEVSASFRPTPFKLKLTPRSELHAELIRGAA